MERTSLILGEDGNDYTGEAYEYGRGALEKLSVACASIKDQCDNGVGGAPCLNGGTGTGQLQSCVDLTCKYAGCSCK